MDVVKRQTFRSAQAWTGRETSEDEARLIAEGLNTAKKRMGKYYHQNQSLGRRETIGCVALEITQRCNLDCTLCYLSENSENTKDIPIEKIYERIDAIYRAYGPGTSVQVTGGDPTMRKRSELVEIVGRIRQMGMHPALFTNGIKATRDLLAELAEVGLNDVAFHVDLTQERKGYKTEMELNVVRKEYMERARGLGITVLFNTTVHDDNYHEVPDLVRFFVDNADIVRMCSFQVQADTGRGELRAKDEAITIKGLEDKINAACGRELGWDVFLIGHPDCNRFAPTFVADGKVFNVIEDKQLFSDFLEDFKHVTIDRRDSLIKIAKPFVQAAIKKPSWVYRGAKFVGMHLWNARRELLRTQGKFSKITFFIHNFMDAQNLVCDRIDTCSFMVITEEGPVSMCAHNAKRDQYILQPLQLKTKDGTVKVWDPRVSPDVMISTRTVADAYDGKATSTCQAACSTEKEQHASAT